MADALAQTSRVDETPRAPAEFDDGVDRVDGCAGNVVHDGPLVTGQLVEQAGLSDVRLSDESNTTRAAAGDTFTRGFRQLLENLVEQVAGTAAVGRTHGVRLTEAQGPQCCNLGLGASVVHLVGNEDDRSLRAAKHSSDRFVRRRSADNGVDDQENGVSRSHGQLGLTGNGLLKALCVGFPSAGVLDEEASSGPVRLIRDAVTSDAGDVLDYRFTTADDAVDERRLADVRSTDNSQGRDGNVRFAFAFRFEIGVIPLRFLGPSSVTGIFGYQIVAHCTAPVLSLTTNSNLAITSSIPNSLVSTRMESSAGRNGDTARVESRWSRRCTSASTAS